MLRFKQIDHEPKTYLSNASNVHKQVAICTHCVLFVNYPTKISGELRWGFTHLLYFCYYYANAQCSKSLTIMFKRCDFYAPLCLHQKIFP